MDEQPIPMKRIIWLTGLKAGEVEPPWPVGRPLTPAIERLIEDLAKIDVEAFLAEERAKADRGDSTPS